MITKLLSSPKPCECYTFWPKKWRWHSSEHNHRHVLETFNQNGISQQHPGIAGHLKSGSIMTGETHNPPASAPLCASGRKICGFLWAFCSFQVCLPPKGWPNSLVLHKPFPLTSDLFSVCCLYKRSVFHKLSLPLQWWRTLLLWEVPQNYPNTFAINWIWPEFQQEVNSFKQIWSTHLFLNSMHFIAEKSTEMHF